MPQRKQSKKSKKKPDTAKSERDGISHAINGFPAGDWKGVEIHGRPGMPNIEPDQEKGVEIYDPRHGKG